MEIKLLCQECKYIFTIIEVEPDEIVICPCCNNNAARLFYIKFDF